MIDDREVAVGLALAMVADALVDGGQIVKHAVGRRDVRLEVAEARPAPDPWLTQSVGTPSRVVWTASTDAGEPALQLAEDVGAVGRKGCVLRFAHAITPRRGSAVQRLRCRSARFWSLMHGGSGRSTPCGPTTQLSGRFSVPTSLLNSSRPSMKASGRGGQPGT